MKRGWALLLVLSAVGLMTTSLKENDFEEDSKWFEKHLGVIEKNRKK
ncbi:MAG: hypothetical protein ACPGAP_00270 [Akkermansiaceae bacterium]